MTMEHKILPFTIDAIDGEGRTLEGYAAAFNNVDLVKDIIHPGAFAKTLAERGNKVRLLWQHKTDEPIGRPVELREDAKGLFIKAIISDTSRGRDVLALLKDKAIDSMSIGYEVVQSDYDQKDDDNVRNLRELKLYEVSPVTFPANEEAIVTGVKQETPEPDEPEAVLTSDDSGVPEDKAGRVLSAKNRTLLTKCTTELKQAVDAIGALLDATDPAPKTDTSEEPEAPAKAAPGEIETKTEDAEPDGQLEPAPLTDQAAVERDRLLVLIELEENENG